ncbi:MAG: alpha/beta hydrolase [Selenomonadaceae bacterium]|nr:alpha/beta hydrolase [Selenomonadaceae bacterium]
MNKSLLYIKGKGGCAEEADHYKTLFLDYYVFGLDYQGSKPWNVKSEILTAYHQLATKYKSVSVIANSIGAYFVMNALSSVEIERAFFISPIVDMEKVIIEIMLRSGVTETELEEKKEIKTSFGEILSWDYLCYVKSHPIVWNIRTDILYGENDNLTSMETISEFAKRNKATLTIMKNGEHWFHTEEQMAFLDKWIKNCLQ